MNSGKHSGIKFPVGYHSFHKKQVYNYQLNRWYSLGCTSFEEMQEAGKRIRSFADWQPVFMDLADRALEENRFLSAAFCYRAAEFYTFEDDEPDKTFSYEKFSRYFYVTAEAKDFERIRIPYGSSFLPTLRIIPENPIKGTIILHGGFDSFIKEFYLIMKYLAGHGYQVIGFEGPGQGAALIRNRLHLDYRWEKPVKAILDHFEPDDITIFGLSMGGWYCLRAAAFEPRIKRVIAAGHAVDYMEIPPRPLGSVFKFFLNYENFFNKSSYRKMKRNPKAKWEITNLMHITGKSTPAEAAKYIANLSRENMHPEKITQDVFLPFGRNDHFIPYKMHHRQIRALIHANTVTERTFIKKEHADNHCQIGNMRLLLDSILDWLSNHRS